MVAGKAKTAKGAKAKSKQSALREEFDRQSEEEEAAERRGFSTPGFSDDGASLIAPCQISCMLFLLSKSPLSVRLRSEDLSIALSAVLHSLISSFRMPHRHVGSQCACHTFSPRNQLSALLMLACEWGCRLGFWGTTRKGPWEGGRGDGDQRLGGCFILVKARCVPERSCP